MRCEFLEEQEDAVEMGEGSETRAEEGVGVRLLVKLGVVVAKEAGGDGVLEECVVLEVVLRVMTVMGPDLTSRVKVTPPTALTCACCPVK